MKKALLFLLAMLFVAGFALAQDEIDWEARNGVFFDFENPDSSLAAWHHFSCGGDADGQIFDVVENPDQSGINTSEYVAYFLTNEACTWEGMYSDDKFMPIDFGAFPFLLVKVWAPEAGLTFMAKIEDYDNNTNSPIEVQATTTTAYEWEELEFDFSAADGNDVEYRRIVIFPDFNGTSVTDWYFDDIRLEGFEDNAAEQKSLQASSFLMAQNYPNPFNPTTTIEYSLPSRADVNLAVYDLQGKEVALLVNENQSAGTYTVPFNGAGLASGIYVYKVEAGQEIVSRKMLLTK